MEFDCHWLQIADAISEHCEGDKFQGFGSSRRMTGNSKPSNRFRTADHPSGTVGTPGWTRVSRDTIVFACSLA